MCGSRSAARSSTRSRLTDRPAITPLKGLSIRERPLRAILPPTCMLAIDSCVVELSMRNSTASDLVVTKPSAMLSSSVSGWRPGPVKEVISHSHAYAFHCCTQTPRLAQAFWLHLVGPSQPETTSELGTTASSVRLGDVSARSTDAMHPSKPDRDAMLEGSREYISLNTPPTYRIPSSSRCILLPLAV
uniref:Uncharacterized protein n=1 Tax=Anopheles coluzzii TaxID=1518534 RepID=A0A8W7PM44_ANOCL